MNASAFAWAKDRENHPLKTNEAALASERAKLIQMLKAKRSKAEPSEAEQIAEEMRGFAFFRDFPSDALLDFASMATSRVFAADETLLEQGSINKRMFFLRTGVLAVYVDGEKVTELTKLGEVIGEMSLINRKPAGASVKAQGETTTFEVDEDMLLSLVGERKAIFQGLLGRACASVLAERLRHTNQKAKRFEIANRDLQAAQAALRRVNEGLEFEIARRSSELVDKVVSLTETHLRPTQLSLARLSHDDAGPIPKTEMFSLLSSVSEVIDFLKPVADLAGRTGLEATRRVLLIEPSKKQQAIAQLALGGTGVDLSVASTLEEFEALVAEREFDTVLCDASLKAAAVRMAHLRPQMPLVLLTGLDRAAYLSLIGEFPDRACFVSRDADNRAFTIKDISSAVTKMLNQDLFGLEKHLASGARIAKETVCGSKDRGVLIESMRQRFLSLGVRSAILDRAAFVAEELLMNAIYDAPCNASGSALFNMLPRTHEVELAQDQRATFRYGTDGIFVGLSVSDPFGSLSKAVIMRYLKSFADGTEGKLDPAKGGAGRGLKMLIDSADLTIFNIRAQQRTEVVALFNLEARASDTSTSTFHIFSLD